MKSGSILFGVFIALFLLASFVSAIPHLINYEGNYPAHRAVPLRVIM